MDDEVRKQIFDDFKKMITTESVVGEPIYLGDATIVPFVDISFGFGSGGGDLPSSQKELFGGGTGGGVTITPMAFLIVRNGDVKLIQVQSYNNTADRLVGMVPDVVDKVSGLISGSKKEKPAEEE